MKIKHHDIVIPKDEPFKFCQLGRKKYAEVLTNIVNTYADGFVMSINNEWGTGKTTFVKMWKQHLENNDFKTLYFNAWESDLESDVLVALISEIKELKDKNSATAFKSVVKNASPLAKKLLPTLLKSLTSKYVGEDFVKEIINGTIEAGVDVLTEEMALYSKRKKNLDDFRTSLTNFVKKTSPNKPVVFIIDELDRCRPNYAVQVLEQIKHLFSVPGIVFVLSIDKTQLGHAIRGVYGSELIDAEEYLKRFIDIEYSIPISNIEVGQFCKYLYNYFQFDEFFRSDARMSIQALVYETTAFIDMATMFFENSHFTLRQQEKIFAYARLVLKTFKETNYVLPGLFFFLIYTKIQNPLFYKKINGRELTNDQLLDGFKATLEVGKILNSDTIDSFAYLEAILLYSYNNANAIRNKDLINTDDKTGVKSMTVTSRIDNSNNSENLLERISRFNNHRDLYRISISAVLKRIDLTEPFFNPN
ncbi:MAG: hypothetical protein CVT99_00955 [Bacteroidetes bacterium HGW-Bacteroidetes-16]|jgi:hypothetical protein|nr:MAG: hypothetical protein CVT99_00955 [Bacteroidetes bacterium HGW-Bacteroidetes-16]